MKRPDKTGATLECRTCKKDLPLSDFRPKTCVCKKCLSKKRAIAKRAQSPEARLWNWAKSRAKLFGRDFDIEVGDIVIPKFCPLLGIPLESKGNGVRYCSPTLDRKDNSKGYVKGNVAVISSAANRFKKDLSIDELHRLSENLASYILPSL